MAFTALQVCIEAIEIISVLRRNMHGVWRCFLGTAPGAISSLANSSILSFTGKSDTTPRSAWRHLISSESPRAHPVSTSSEITSVYFSRSVSHQRRVIPCRPAVTVSWLCRAAR
jgi:hypothetical protein